MSDHVTVVLVRHAAHDALGRRLSGRMPGIGLGARGREEAGRLAQALAREDISAVYTSPVQRAEETAQASAAALGLDAVPCEALNEINFGTWAGASFEDLDSDPRWLRWNEARSATCPPGGETMGAVANRMAALLDLWRVAHPGLRIAAFSHADVIKAAVCRVLGLSFDHHHTFDIDPASRSTLVAWQGGAKILSLNEGLPA